MHHLGRHELSYKFILQSESSKIQYSYYLINSTLNVTLKPTQLKPIKIAQSSSKRKLNLLIKTAILSCVVLMVRLYICGVFQAKSCFKILIKHVISYKCCLELLTNSSIFPTLLMWDSTASLHIENNEGLFSDQIQCSNSLPLTMKIYYMYVFS